MSFPGLIGGTSRAMTRCLEAGAQFVVIGENDVVLLKSIAKQSMAEFDRLISRARRQARVAGMKKSDISVATARARLRK